MILRDFQTTGCDWIEASWNRLPTIGKRAAVVYQLPTGGGKTPMQAELVERAQARGLTAAVMAPGVDLCRQLRARVCCEVHLTTTLAARFKAGRELPSADVWLVDEARCITSAGVSPVVLALQAGGARFAFFDATPETAQGRGLGAWADDLRQGPSVKELVAAGHLVPSRVFSAEQGRGLAMTPVEAWLHLYWYGRILRIGETAPIEIAAGPMGRKRRALVFAKDKAHARAVVAEFAARRVPAAFIGDDTPEIERQRLLGWTDAHGIFRPGALARGEVLALVCASLLRQGIDIPEIELVVSARAFDSEPLARQAWGRGMRTWPEGGKVDCVMVDLIGGIVDRVGLPDDPRAWSLEGEACRAAGEALPPAVKCVFCHAWGRGGLCTFCKRALPPPPPPPVLVRDLVEQFAREPADVKAEYLARMARIAVEKGYKPGWVGVKYSKKYGAYPARGAADRAIEQARQEQEASCPRKRAVN